MSARALVEHVEHATSLDVIAITDHDEVSGALEGREWAAKQGYRVQVIPGVEVTTRHGHLLALWLEERPPALRPLAETADWVMRRGGLCIAAHPFTRLTHSLRGPVLERAAVDGLMAGVEVLNASPAGRDSGRRARHFATAHGLARIGGSDAHMLRMVGLAYTRFNGRDPADLRRAIESGATSAAGRHARASEIAAEALPQLARSMVYLPIRRLSRIGPAVRARRQGSALACSIVPADADGGIAP
jgi:predicted metal-dependent phosphoesterase TrpH